MSRPSSQDEPLPLPLARRVDAVCCRFEAAWKAAIAGGTAPQLEAYLADGPAAARAADADALCPHWAYVTDGVVAGAHAAGLRVLVWTADEADVIRRCVALGVDGITSNDSRLLRRVLGT